MEGPGDAVAAFRAADVPAELVGRDRAVFLLRIAAEIEHSLMAQYLFAGYSLGGPQVLPARVDEVRGWQEIVLGIAKEEMAHLLTVQNLLVSLGAAVHLDREDFPNESAFYPFGFRLRPADLDTLATYVCAESPDTWSGPEADEITTRATAEVGGAVNRVGVLYAQVAAALTAVAESDFATTRAGQAVFDDWGRGYRAGQRGRAAMLALPGLPAPELLILPVTSRASALAAVTAIGEQGEAFETPPDEDESHFRRFLGVYRAMTAAGEAGLTRPVAANPTVAGDVDDDPADTTTTTPITHPRARLWGQLANVRYRKLLLDLAHTTALARDPANDRWRGLLVHWTFGEMYQLRALAGRLVELPVSEQAGEARAGLPFDMPFTTTLPPTDAGRWMLHRDLLDAAAALITRLKELGDGPAEEQDHLLALAESDRAERVRVDAVLAGPGNGVPQ
jgi:hypothetical protein